MAVSLDVVIPVYGHYELTCGCLEHLERQTIEHRVIVVDDGSPDGTSDRLREDWPGVTVVALGSNHGYTYAVNRGVAAGDGEYVVLLNNDAQLGPDCLERLVAPLERDQTVGSVAALMLMPDEQTIDSFGVTADKTLAGFARLHGRPASAAGGSRDGHARGDRHGGADGNTGAEGRGKTEPSMPVLTGAEGTAGAYRRSAWERVGGLDETIVAYMEILDLALRLRTAGWLATGAADAKGVHLGSSTYGKRSARQRRMSGFSRGYLLRRYGVLRGRTAPRALVTEAVVVAGDLALCHDIEALRGRLAGWRAARGLARHPKPPASAVDSSITLSRSLRLRRGAVSGT